MRCPRDGTGLMPTEFMQVTMDVCPCCDGTYLDKGELARIHGLPQDLPPEVGLQAWDPHGTIGCPKCAATMVSRWFSPLHKVLVDHCPTCGGVWLDTEELKRLVREAYEYRHRSG
ncbi:MAG TPA: zf-TFIIB domain-containing protein [Candidatus Nitrosotenuis sp.]|jgi:Zn-finger nucleic acid-binding protein|nr:zf-TFIIB domain-containing protein [Candidatus Nitrosotenuis sp.]